MDSYRTKHRTLSYSFTDHHSQLISSEVSQADKNTERAIDGVINAAFKIPQILSLATLLDSGNGEGDLGPTCRALSALWQAGLLTNVLLMMDLQRKIRQVNADFLMQPLFISI